MFSIVFKNQLSHQRNPGMNTVRIACAVAALILMESVSQAMTWDAADDFSPGSNPSLPWTYGWSSTLGGTMQLCTSPSTWLDGKIDGWRADEDLLPPSVSHNNTNEEVTESSVTYAAKQMSMHPGPGGEYAIVRWIAPESASISILGSFSGMDHSGTTTDVHLLYNGTSIYDGMVSGYGAGSTSPFSTLKSVSAGDTIDFIVGFGSNNNYICDGTGLDAQILSVPEPATSILLGIAAACLMGLARYRRSYISNR
jgi:hypothetical protein